jgi:hypothetical protein
VPAAEASARNTSAASVVPFSDPLTVRPDASREAVASLAFGSPSVLPAPTVSGSASVNVWPVAGFVTDAVSVNVPAVVRLRTSASAAPIDDVLLTVVAAGTPATENVTLKPSSDPLPATVARA